MSSTLSGAAMPHALILAAGRGRRLGGDAAAEDSHAPKVLLAFEGRTLLQRHLETLRACGVRDVTLVLGYRHALVEAELARLGAEDVRVVLNPDYREGSVVSLQAGAAVLRSGAPLLLMDGDVLYDARLMRRLLGSEQPECLLMDRDIEPGDEPVKLCIRGGEIVDFRKQPTVSHDWHGESVGFFRFTPATARELADRVDGYVATGRRNMEYEEPIRDMILESPPGRFGFEDISGLPWTEIDFPEDVAKAESLLAELAA